MVLDLDIVSDFLLFLVVVEENKDVHSSFCVLCLLYLSGQEFISAWMFVSRRSSRKVVITDEIRNHTENLEEDRPTLWIIQLLSAT